MQSGIPKVLKPGDSKPGTLTAICSREELGTDHKLVTAELARAWSLPEPMLAAYQCRALADGALRLPAWD